MAEMQHNECADVAGKVTLQKKRGRRPKPIQIASDMTTKALLTKGISIRKAAEILGVSPTTIQRTKDRLRAQGEEISSLFTPVRDEKLGKLIDHFVDKGIKMKKIKGSDALGAGKIYADRRYPVRQPEVAGGDISFTQINISVLSSEPETHKTIEIG